MHHASFHAPFAADLLFSPPRTADSSCWARVVLSLGSLSTTIITCTKLTTVIHCKYFTTARQRQLSIVTPYGTVNVTWIRGRHPTLLKREPVI